MKIYASCEMSFDEAYGTSLEKLCIALRLSLRNITKNTYLYYNEKKVVAVSKPQRDEYPSDEWCSLGYVNIQSTKAAIRATRKNHGKKD